MMEIICQILGWISTIMGIIFIVGGMYNLRKPIKMRRLKRALYFSHLEIIICVFLWVATLDYILLVAITEWAITTIFLFMTPELISKNKIS